MQQWILQEIEEKEKVLNECKREDYLYRLEYAARAIYGVIQKGNKILLAGNGGSAADAQHFAGEMVGRFLKDRDALPAISLCVDPSVITCICNDYGYEQMFARQIQGLGKPGDIFLGISTSGNSPNIVYAMKEAKKRGMYVIGFLGGDGGEAEALCDIALLAPSHTTPRIQEIHTFTVHILCGIIEQIKEESETNVRQEQDCQNNLV